MFQLFITFPLPIDPIIAINLFFLMESVIFFNAAWFSSSIHDAVKFFISTAGLSMESTLLRKSVLMILGIKAKSL